MERYKNERGSAEFNYTVAISINEQSKSNTLPNLYLFFHSEEGKS